MKRYPARDRAAIRRRLAKGLCRSCPRPRYAGRTRCLYHLLRQSVDNKARYARRKEERGQLGLCMRCDEPACAGRLLCYDHLVRDIERAVAWQRRKKRQAKKGAAA